MPGKRIWRGRKNPRGEITTDYALKMIFKVNGKPLRVATVPELKKEILKYEAKGNELLVLERQWLKKVREELASKLMNGGFT
ncbi:MAG: hypothetical protein Q7S21_07135 [archaeon]|nr:hypothetical protein [archaeon]